MIVTVSGRDACNQWGKAMKINVGTVDRVVRVVVGLALITAAAMGRIGLWGWLGVIPLATGLFRFCPAYTLLGMNSCAAPKKM
jgi:Protein of unknown function (DUF2892)